MKKGILKGTAQFLTKELLFGTVLIIAVGIHIGVRALMRARYAVPSARMISACRCRATSP